MDIIRQEEDGVPIRRSCSHHQREEPRRAVLSELPTSARTAVRPGPGGRPRRGAFLLRAGRGECTNRRVGPRSLENAPGKVYAINTFRIIVASISRFRRRVMLASIARFGDRPRRRLRNRYIPHNRGFDFAISMPCDLASLRQSGPTGDSMHDWWFFSLSGKSHGIMNETCRVIAGDVPDSGH